MRSYVTVLFPPTALAYSQRQKQQNCHDLQQPHTYHSQSKNIATTCDNLTPTTTLYEGPDLTPLRSPFEGGGGKEGKRETRRVKGGFSKGASRGTRRASQGGFEKGFSFLAKRGFEKGGFSRGASRGASRGLRRGFEKGGF